VSQAWAKGLSSGSIGPDGEAGGGGEGEGEGGSGGGEDKDSVSG